ncbi:MAG: GMC family oxidoreductase N-terminal domain-containing protein [Betaproteobacteria bacterium]|nr:GMC family oxidoreductase N-terminal domain-containing protein [Betaproteobacteria bacterium]
MSITMSLLAPGLKGRSLRYPRGKTLGGSSSINGRRARR